MENYKTITKMSKWYQKYFYRKDAKGLRKERKVLNLRNIFFAFFAKNRCVFAVKKIKTLNSTNLIH
jgi:hypothetical protein